MTYVWDYRTGDIIDVETGAVVDRIYVEDEHRYPIGKIRGDPWHYDIILPSVSLSRYDRRRYGKVMGIVTEILGRPLTGKERARLARWLVAAKRLCRYKKDDSWLRATLYMFLSDMNVDPTPYVPIGVALRASSVTRPNRYVMVVRRIRECLEKLGRPHLVEVAEEVARVLFRRFPTLASGRSASVVAATAIYIASVMTEEDPVPKRLISRTLGIKYFSQKRALVVNNSPFTVLADVALCEAVSRRVKLHQRVSCVDMTDRDAVHRGAGPGGDGAEQSRSLPR